MRHTIIIAEAGVNHNGDIATAKRLIDVAAEAKVDYVKFQTFKTEKLVSRNANMAEYQKKNTGHQVDSQYEMIKKLELDRHAHIELQSYCLEKGVRFLSTAFDLDSIDLLDGMGIELFKIPSGEITNKPYLEKIASKNKPIVMSTGMSTLEEVEEAVSVLQSECTDHLDLTLLHCNTQYPTPMSDVHLRAMLTMAEKFNVPIGYSDHTLGIEVAIAAVALGAQLIEKHFTLDRSMPGPDHRSSLEPEELFSMVRSIRNIEIAMGSGIKQPSPSEAENIAVARKSIHTSKPLKKDTTIQRGDIIMKRPGSGMSPMLIDQVLGKTLKRDVPIEHMLNQSDII